MRWWGTEGNIIIKKVHIIIEQLKKWTSTNRKSFQARKNLKSLQKTCCEAFCSSFEKHKRNEERMRKFSFSSHHDNDEKLKWNILFMNNKISKTDLYNLSKPFFFLLLFSMFSSSLSFFLRFNCASYSL
jgi:hypothetical protein